MVAAEIADVAVRNIDDGRRDPLSVPILDLHDLLENQRLFALQLLSFGLLNLLKGHFYLSLGGVYVKSRLYARQFSSNRADFTRSEGGSQMLPAKKIIKEAKRSEFDSIFIKYAVP
jgi:hypothetical protein